MKVIHHIKKLFPFRKAVAAESGTSVVIIDAESLMRGSDRSRQLPAQDKIGILKRLVEFVEKEKVTVVAVLRGQPLRVAEDGGQFRGVTVRYTGVDNGVATFIAGILKKHPHGRMPVVITGNRDVEQAAAALGAPVMQPATFKKAFEQDQPRPQQKPQDRPQPRPQERKQQNRPEPEPLDENERIVRELIDPL